MKKSLLAFIFTALIMVAGIAGYNALAKSEKRDDVMALAEKFMECHVFYEVFGGGTGRYREAARLLLIHRTPRGEAQAEAWLTEAFDKHFPVWADHFETQGRKESAAAINAKRSACDDLKEIKDQYIRTPRTVYE